MSVHYPDEIIEDVRVSNDIVDVANEYVRLEKKGKDYFGLCPFHKEKTPSFSVVPAKQIFYCFGCGKGGNVIQFVMQAENLDYIESVRYLADRVRIQLPEGESEEEREKARLKQEVIRINTEAARFFHESLKKSTIALEYLRNRGITENTVRKFGLGYSPEDWDSLYRHLSDKGFEEKNVIVSGLVKPKNNDGYYDRFRGRIIFPIFDIRSNIIGFGGRVLDSSQPKYLNSPETCVYNKGRNLYALNFAKNSGQKRVIIVEGYMDVISLHQGGIINTVASLGTALTENQGRLLKKYAEEVIISYDADTAGQAATMRGLDLLNDIGCNVKVLVIPDGKDPDEFIRKKGTNELQEHINNAISLIEYKIRVLKTQINTESVDGKISFINKMAAVLSKVDNRVEMEIYIKKIAEEYRISEESILSEVYRRIKPKASLRNGTFEPKESSRIEAGKEEDRSSSEILHYERMVLALLCIDNSIYKLVRDRLEIEDFSNEDSRKYADIVFKRLDEKRGFVPGELLNILDTKVADIFARIIQKECNFEDNKKAVVDIIKRMKLFKLDIRKQEILHILNDKNSLQERDVEKLKVELNSILLGRQSMQ